MHTLSFTYIHIWHNNIFVYLQSYNNNLPELAELELVL